MRTIQLTCLLTFFIAASAPAAHAETGVTETFVADPGYEGGGYYELTVTNSTTENMYVLTVGNSGADVMFTAPSLVGQWYPDRWDPVSWDEGLSFSGAGFTPPNTMDYPFASYFAGYDQVLVYYMLAAGSPIAPGETRGGFRFIAAIGGSPYVIFGGDGSIVAQGETTDPALPVEDRTWGAVKALYR